MHALGGTDPGIGEPTQPAPGTDPGIGRWRPRVSSESGSLGRRAAAARLRFQSGPGVLAPTIQVESLFVFQQLHNFGASPLTPCGALQTALPVVPVILRD